MDLVHGTGVEFVDMARATSSSSATTSTSSAAKLEQILELIRENRYH